ncbi:hypothetical protein HYQ57_0154 [Lactobacillus crispatus]|nr:hypothetical protein [Lactobacillus crispatus]
MTPYTQSEVVDLLNLDKKKLVKYANYGVNFVHKIKIMMGHTISLKELVQF